MTALRHLRRPERPRGSAQSSPGVLRGDNALAAQSTVGKVRNRRAPGGGAVLAAGTRSPPGRAEGERGRGPGRAGSGGRARAGAARGGGEEARRARGGGEARRDEGRERAAGPAGRGARGSQPPLRSAASRPLALGSQPASPRAPGCAGGATGRRVGLGLPRPPRPALPRRAPRAWARFPSAAPPAPRPPPARPAPPPPAGLAARAGAGSLNGRPACSAPLSSALSGKGPAPRAGRELLKRHTRLPAPSAERASRGVSPSR